MPPGVVDPAYVPWATRYDEIMVAGGFDQNEAPGFFGCEPPYLPLASRPDVLVFQTEPLSEDVEVTGPIDVKLWVSSSAPDTDFTAKLIDVYPPSPGIPTATTSISATAFSGCATGRVTAGLTFCRREPRPRSPLRFIRQATFS